MACSCGPNCTNPAHEHKEMKLARSGLKKKGNAKKALTSIKAMHSSRY